MHTPEPLYMLHFRDGREAARFVENIRNGLESRSVRRQTPPGPLVIYGPALTGDRSETTLFVTAGVLRAAELLVLRVEQAGKITSGAEALPPWAVTLFAGMGDVGIGSSE